MGCAGAAVAEYYFSIENSFGTRTQRSLNGTSKLTKVALKKGVPLPDRFGASRVEPI